MCSGYPMGKLDLEKGSVLRIRFTRIDDEEVCQQEVGQWMCPIVGHRPVELAIKTVPHREIGVQTCPIGTLIGLGEVERVLHVVQVTDFEVAVEGIELLGGQ